MEIGLENAATAVYGPNDEEEIWRGIDGETQGLRCEISFSRFSLAVSNSYSLICFLTYIGLPKL